MRFTPSPSCGTAGTCWTAGAKSLYHGGDELTLPDPRRGPTRLFRRSDCQSVTRPRSFISRRSACLAGLTTGLSGQREIGRDARLRNAIMPGKLILVPKHPEETERQGSRRDQISQTSPHQLPRRRIESIQTGHPKTAQHHSGCRLGEVRKQGHVLDIQKAQDRHRDQQVEPADAETAAKGAKDHQKAAVSK